MYSFSPTSQKKLDTCHPALISICDRLILRFDFTVVTGHRTKEEQDKLYPKFSKVQWPNSKHNQMPSLAVDIAPYTKRFGILFGNSEQLQEIGEYYRPLAPKNLQKETASDYIREQYVLMAGLFQGLSFHDQISIRWGGDWDSDWDTFEEEFSDLGHFELRL